nr:iron chelate uptake ABC transporter family permease subunit [uncultured Celeribacter sp.]
MPDANLRHTRQMRPLIWAGLACALAAVAYLTIGARGDMGFVLSFRGGKLIALCLVAASVAISTVVFQTLSANRILTPAIMGFDALYLLLQTGLVFTLSGVGYASLPPVEKFIVETGVMLIAAMVLFGALLRRGNDLSKMVLTGIIFGVLFRSLTSLLNRLIDPSEFAVVQSASFAQFNAVNTDLLWIAGAVTLLACGLLMLRHRKLDVMALGRDTAIALGVNHDRETRLMLGLVAVLVSVSTALVGPVVFFGLLAAALAYRLAGTWRHALLLPLSALTAATILIASQTLFERVLKLSTSVSVVIEALGGLLFLVLILKGSRR